MAVSKRLRYEILRRDNFTCRYCGRSAPDVPLTVDHVLAVALGGSDEATNLVTACRDCNSGKSSVPVDAALVENVKLDALRWSAALRTAITEAELDLEAAHEYRDYFVEAWGDWKFGTKDDQQTVPLDDTWETSIENFRTRGLPLDHLLECIPVAMTRPGVPTQNVFRYMCGIAWNKISVIEASARAIFETGS